MTEMWSVRACRVCLASGNTHKLFRIEPLLHCYRALVGLTDVTGPNYVCFECSAYLQKFNMFREKSLKALGLLELLIASGNEISQDTVELVDRENSDLNSSLKICQMKYWEHINDATVSLPKIETEQDESTEWIVGIDNVKEESKEHFESEFLSVPAIDVEDEKPLVLYSEAKIMRESLRSKEKVKNIRVKATSGTKKKSLPSLSQKRKVLQPQKKTKRKPFESRKLRAEYFSKFVDVVLMTQEEALDVIRRRRNTANFKTATYKCEMCYKGFWEEASFKNHMVSHDSSQGKFQCDFCRVHFTSRNCIVKHIRARHKWKFCCRKCPQVCNDGSLAMKHEAWHNGASYSCKHCDAKFNFYTSMKNHVRIKHATELSCRLCGRCFVGARGIQVHIAKSHGGQQTMDGEEEHACVECDIKFATVEALKRHRVVSARHNLMETECGCRDCGDVFPTRDAYVQHRRLAHARNYTAARHKMYADSRGSVVRKRPNRIRAKRAARAAGEGAGAGGARTGVMCDICGKVFSTKYTLRDHMWNHTSERPYACGMCPKTFAARVVLQCHERTHTREQPYRCAKCGRAFSTSSNLGRHVQSVHTEAGPVHCNICNKPFKNVGCMKDHVKYVHLKKPYPVRKGRNRKNQNTQRGADNDPLCATESDKTAQFD